jgi:hypothetical protein
MTEETNPCQHEIYDVHSCPTCGAGVCRMCAVGYYRLHTKECGYVCPCCGEKVAIGNPEEEGIEA